MRNSKRSLPRQLRKWSTPCKPKQPTDKVQYIDGLITKWPQVMFQTITTQISDTPIWICEEVVLAIVLHNCLRTHYHWPCSELTELKQNTNNAITNYRCHNMASHYKNKLCKPLSQLLQNSYGQVRRFHIYTGRMRAHSMHLPEYDYTFWPGE